MSGEWDAITRIAWLRAVASDVDAPGSAAKVACVLAHFANCTTGEAFPGLAREVGPDTATAGARWLVAAGFVEAVRQNGRAVVYILRWPATYTEPARPPRKIQGEPPGKSRTNHVR